MKKIFLILIFIFLVSDISASCNSTQIDINSASAKELGNITQVGNATAMKIIAGRPFHSVDDLLNVSGIGPAKLGKIKEQGLACISDNETAENSANNTEKNLSDNETIITKNFSVQDNSKSENANEVQEDNILPNETNETLSPISLNAKDIKTENGMENLQINWPLCGIFAFCIAFGALFLFKKRKRKNEFN